MGAVGTCGRCRRRQAFMNTGSTFMWEICGKTFTKDFRRRGNKSRSWRRKQLINKAAKWVISSMSCQEVWVLTGGFRLMFKAVWIWIAVFWKFGISIPGSVSNPMSQRDLLSLDSLLSSTKCHAFDGSGQLYFSAGSRLWAGAHSCSFPCLCYANLSDKHCSTFPLLAQSSTHVFCAALEAWNDYMEINQERCGTPKRFKSFG